MEHDHHKLFNLCLIICLIFTQVSHVPSLMNYVLSLGHTRSRDHQIARLVTNLGDVRLVATTTDQSLGFIYSLPLTLIRKMYFMIGCNKPERSCDPAHEFIIFIAKASREGLNLRICETSLLSYTHYENRYKDRFGGITV